MLKAAIVVLMLALVASLGSGFYFLMLDQGDREKRRTFHSLGVRLGIATALHGPDHLRCSHRSVGPFESLGWSSKASVHPGISAS